MPEQVACSRAEAGDEGAGGWGWGWACMSTLFTAALRQGEVPVGGGRKFWSLSCDSTDCFILSCITSYVCPS